MGSEPLVGLLGALAVLAVTILGLWWIVKGLIPRDTSQPRDSSPPFGHGIAGFLSAALLFKFLLENYLRDRAELAVIVPIGVVLIAGVALVPALETLVSVMAIVVFLMFNVAEFGAVVLGLFLAMLALFLGLRRLARR